MDPITKASKAPQPMPWKMRDAIHCLKLVVTWMHQKAPMNMSSVEAR